MTRHGPFGHATAPRRRWSTEPHVRFAGAPVSRDPNTSVFIATGSPTWPERCFLDALTAPRADVRGRRWDTSKKSPGSPPAARGFLHERLSYAWRHRKNVSIADFKTYFGVLQMRTYERPPQIKVLAIPYHCTTRS